MQSKGCLNSVVLYLELVSIYFLGIYYPKINYVGIYHEVSENTKIISPLVRANGPVCCKAQG